MFWLVANILKEGIIIIMSERIDIRKVSKGASPETVNKWKETGVIRAANILPEPLEASTAYDLARAHGPDLYKPFPRSIIDSALRSGEHEAEEEQPPAAS
jgi:hypothetical protein